MSWEFRWPEDLTPARASLHAVNVLESDVSAEAVWAWLVRAGRWKDFYSNCWGLELLDASSSGPDLRPGTRFRWWTFGVRVETVVEEFVPCERLAWRGQGLGARGYHAWLLEPVPGGLRLRTEEVQRGVAPRLLRPLLLPSMRHYHQRWLEGLVRVARLGLPDDVTPDVIRNARQGARP
ncbi:MAG TPA: SRPBCC domain-containing protein [Polyangia bacterium]|jgi:hypothetical protein|nr:SRPBCC domain-containing protein [Polyangia bacterium]